jgi:hypothetical protein
VHRDAGGGRLFLRAPLGRSSPESVESGFSLMNATAMTARNAIGAATRNRSDVAVA